MSTFKVRWDCELKRKEKWMAIECNQNCLLMLAKVGWGRDLLPSGTIYIVKANSLSENKAGINEPDNII